ncbi:MAG: ATP-binding protein [Patescibacteria group bacterium]|nr:ATP-binding protein [Patescibacteria group bacterium]
MFFVLAAIAAPLVFNRVRKSFREQKNYERGLKIVPLYIHLPPISDDIELGGRDVRDVTEETISKAQIIYNIIASTIQKGWKSKFYGQRHFGFEIVGSQGFVHFYAAVPIALVDVVRQAIVSAYPTARLEEVAEHNIFSPVGKANGTLGGELSLKESYAYPIATYQDLKRDGMQSLLNALSTLDKEDGAGIQILMRPADPSWRKHAASVASKKRKGNDKKLDAGGILKSIAQAPFKVPETGKDGAEKKSPELSNLDQAILDAVDDKTRHAGFEVLIRVVVSSNVSQRSQAILSNIIASFSLYDAPGKNGFKYAPAKDIPSLATAYIMRFFPQQNTKTILNSVELATLFHFPDQRSIPTSQLTRQESKQVDGPRNIPDEGLLMGYNVFRGAKKAIRLGLGDRQRHMYVVGQTGTGKSTYLENLALQDMISGNGFAFVDPHGDVVEKLLAMVPKERTEDVIYFSPAEMDFPMGLNLFEYNTPDQKDFLIQEVLNMLYKLYDPQHQGIMGPRYEDMFRNAALAIMADPNGGTFVDIPQLFRDPAFLKEKLKHVKDKTVMDFWTKQFPASQRSNESGEVTAWFVSKFGAFLSNEMMRNIIGQTKSAFDLRDIMDNKKILLVNLSKGRTGDLNSKLLGMIFVMKFQAAAMSRSDIPEDDRVDFSLYVDEFQNFSTDSFATIMSEARKYHLNLIVANQFTTQLTQEIRDAVFGNMGTIVSFRIGQNDVESLGKYFQPIFDGDDLLRIPNYNTIVRTLIGGVPTQPFSMATLPALGTPNPRLLDALKQLSAAKFGRPKATVEKEIFARMTVPEPPKPAFAPAGSPFGAAAPSPFAAGTTPAATGPSAPAATSPAAGGSFLDDWLNKRQTMPPATVPATSPVVASTPPPVATAEPLAATPTSPPYSPPEASISPARSSTPTQPLEPLPALARDSHDFSPAVPVTPTASSTAPMGTVNISSEAIERSEVDKIADELRAQLKDKTATEPAAAVEQPAAVPTPVPVEAPLESALLTMPVMPKVMEGDTILIDHDGNMIQSDEVTVS